MKLPMLQFIHNFRPFSPGGTLSAGDTILPHALHGNYLPEILAGSWQGSRLKTLLLSLVLRQLHRSNVLQSVKHWVAISDFMRQKFIEAGIPAGKISTLRHAWDAQPVVNGSGDGGYYLFLSRLSAEKGVAALMAAWNLLHQEMKSAAPQLVVAGDGPQLPLVQAAAAQNEKIHLRGFVSHEKKRDLIANCRAIIAPSVCWEALGLVAYEAYDYSKPVLAAASGGLTETVQDGLTGFLHEPGNPVSMRDSILRCEALASDARRQLGATGRSWLLREANPQRWKESFRKIVASIIESN